MPAHIHTYARAYTPYNLCTNAISYNREIWVTTWKVWQQHNKNEFDLLVLAIVDWLSFRNSFRQRFWLVHGIFSYTFHAHTRAYYATLRISNSIEFGWMFEMFRIESARIFEVFYSGGITMYYIVNLAQFWCEEFKIVAVEFAHFTM